MKADSSGRAPPAVPPALALFAPLALALFEATGIGKLIDDGFIDGNGDHDAAGFLTQGRQLRNWPRRAAESGRR